MGQRTQMIVEVTKTNKDFNSGNTIEQTYLGAYHNQWGIGKMQLFDVIRFVTEYINSCEDYTFPKRLHKAYLLDETPFEGKATPEKVISWMKCQDNNNGGLLLKVNVDEYNYITSGELYIFNDPETDCGRYFNEHLDDDYQEFEVNRQISLLEYINCTPSYFDEPFLTAFTSLMRFYNIEIKKPEEDEGE